MKYVVEQKDAGFVAKFIEGPMQGEYAGLDYSLPTERVQVWPNIAELNFVMTCRGHTEYIFDPVAYLKTQTTHQLMEMREKCYKFGQHIYNISDDPAASNVTLSQVLDELYLRPRVPNKQEAKIIRQQRAHQQRNR